MNKCEQCGGRLRFSRAQQLLECMECGALYAPSSAMVFGASSQRLESQEQSLVPPEGEGGEVSLQEQPVSKGYVPACPSGFSVLNETSTALELEILKKAKAGCFLSFFTIAWNLFMVVWFTIAITTGQWAMVAFGSLHGLVGVFLIFVTLSGLINRRFFLLDLERVVLQTKPLRLPSVLGNFVVTRASTAQIFLSDYGGKYLLMALLRDGTERPLVNNLTWEEARYLEQQIEEFWSIVDDPSADRRIEIPHSVDDYEDDHFYYDDE